MNPSSSTASLAAALVRAEMQRLERADASPVIEKPPFTIAIARQVGARGTTVAREVGQRLGWPVYDREILTRIADELHVPLEQLEAADERPGNWLAEWVAALTTAPSVTETAYTRRLRRLLVTLGKQGKCVIVGRGAGHFLPPMTTLRVRLVAPRKDRIATFAHLRGLTLDEAERGIDKAETERIAFVQTHFHRDPSLPENYDLVLNTAFFSVDACAALIVQALQLRESGAKPVVA